VLVLAVTRGVERSAAGVVFTVTSAFLLVETIVRLGTDGGVVHFVATALGRGQRQQVADVIWASLVPVLGAAVLGGGIAILVTLAVIGSLNVDTAAVHTRWVAATVALTLPFAAVHDLATAATRGLGSSRPTVVVERVARPVLQLVGVIAAVLFHAGPRGLVLGWLAPYVVVAPWTVLWLARLLRRHGIPLRSSRWPSRFVPVWRFTLPRSLASVTQILLQRLDIILVGALLGGPAAAVYTGATRFVVVGQLGNQAMSFAFQPQLARLISRGQLAEAKVLFRMSTAWIVGLTAPLYLAVCVTSPLLVRLLGSHYRSGLSSLLVVTGAMLVANACGLVDMVLITMGRTTWNLANTVASLVVNIAIDLVLIPQIGIVGAAIGWATAIIGSNLVPAVQIHRAFGFSPFSSWWARLLAVAGVGFGVIPGIVLAVAGPHVAPLVVALVVVTAAYVAVVWRWRGALAVDQLVPSRRRASASVA
jgi:O-antigen/teichoic acid export membrane protein